MKPMTPPIFVGKSATSRNLRGFIQKAAVKDFNVLILGETGVGKELAARLIHEQSQRSRGPFIKINAANLHEHLLESELFGCRKGAFTGAIYDRPGLLEEAEGGTFFLDEIADIPPFLQAKLLSVIEDQEIRRIGENRNRKVDVRFVFATNQDLIAQIQKGKFRPDLFFRISVITLTIPPLRERQEDLPLLIDFLLQRHSSRSDRPYSIEPEARAKLLDYHYPGNVRELDNVLARAIAFSDNHTVSASDVFFTVFQAKSITGKKTKFTSREILSALIRHRGNKSKAAIELGISRRHLYRVLNW